ncbi:hypothetical protein WMY93_029598 [Mugilogobius chulae]|uniref:FIIND domain-containing protein n=1 Tax=Mugilogobius chulae TaxID=88201 RepID=A0AAW0MT67_9GOBI
MFFQTGLWSRRILHQKYQQNPGTFHSGSDALALGLPLFFHWIGVVVSKEAELQYRIIQWDEALLESSSRTPAGPLYDIECPEKALFELHLPHCEPEHVDVSESRLSVAHITDSGVTFIEPQQVTKSHVVIRVSSLSGFGLVWHFLVWLYQKFISSQILLFLSAQNPKTKRRKLNVLLLPINVSVDEVGHKQPNMRNVQVPANCNFTVKQKYSLECSKAFKVQPKEAEFFLNYGPNYHPTFEVRLTAENELINITIRDKDQTQVWLHEVDLSDVIAEELRQSSETLPSSRSLLFESDETLKRWLSSVRPDFIQRVSEPVLNQVLDRLLACGVLTMAESESLRSRGRWTELLI